MLVYISYFVRSAESPKGIVPDNISYTTHPNDHQSTAGA